MHKVIRIGTRDSKLALWQAHHVSDQLQKIGFETEIISVKSDGDLLLHKPLYELGIIGIFTKTLDIAMLEGKIDIAVHSMKDVPTILPKGIVKAAVLERGKSEDVLVYKKDLDFLAEEGIIATGSLRRKAQWLNRFPLHEVEDLRGNVQTRLQKLENNNWNGAIFAKAGLERLCIDNQKYTALDWMLPAPAQGALMVVALEDDVYSRNAMSQLNNTKADVETHIERQFLKTLEGGCTAPIAALAQFDEEFQKIVFKGNLLSIDGKDKIEVEKTIEFQEWENAGILAANEILNNGGKELMQNIGLELKK